MRPEKIAFVEHLRGEIESSEYLILAEYQGITVAQTEEFRKKLAEKNATFRVVKNKIFKVVADELGITGMDGYLSGSTAIVFGSGDVVDVAKVVKASAKEIKSLEIKCGALERNGISKDDVIALAEMPPKEIMYGMLVGTIAAPMTQLVGVMQQKIASVVYVLQAYKDQKEENNA
ncbi:MAG: 50S ribosomal protein L10 [Spartobacteria bacterium]|nr:50S ribosomal protein L10 [Spartobacteria bacterium]